MKVEVQLGADANPFVRGVKIAERAMSGFGLKATSTLKGIAGSALGVSFGVAGIGIALYSATSRLKGAFDFGDKLGEMKEQTGIAVRELVILEQGAKDAGVSMEALGVAVNKMQQKITTGGKELGLLGVDLQKLKTMDPGKQFIAIGKAISGVADAAQRAAIVKDIFGRGGGSLLAMFSDPNFGVGTAALTTQAELLERNAAIFGRVSDKLKNTGIVMRGFFLGLAETVAPTLERILDRYEKFDWVGQGKAFGDSLASGASAVEKALTNSWNFLQKTDRVLNNITLGMAAKLDRMGFPIAGLSEPNLIPERRDRTRLTPDFWNSGDPRAQGSRGIADIFKTSGGVFMNEQARTTAQLNDLNKRFSGFGEAGVDRMITGGTGALERWGERMGVERGAHTVRRSRTALANEAEREARKKDRAGEKVELGEGTTDKLKAGFKDAVKEIVVE